jgi:hypothetical protein
MKKRPISGEWPSSLWTRLLELARQTLDTIGVTDWAFGGGSAMAFRLGHRISYDADIFLHDPQSLAYLSPNTNDMIAALADSYQQSAHSLKIVTKRGDIDFIVGNDLTEASTAIERIEGRETRCHTNAEILAKKIEFRGPSFTMRDMFDLAVLIDRDPDSVDKALAACTTGNIEIATRRIAGRLPTLAAELPGFVNPTASGARYIDAAPALLRERFKL